MLIHKFSVLSLVAGLFASTCVLAQVPPYDEMIGEVRERCLQAAVVDYPALDRPSVARSKELARCDPYAPYYGIGTNTNWVEARHCAFVQQHWGVLMMLYANGQGVERNYPVAHRAACDASGAPREIEGRLDRLADMEFAGNQAKVIDICDVVSSGGMMAFCADLHSRRNEASRRSSIESFQAHWESPEKLAYAKVRQAEEKFAELRAWSETDQRGTGYIAFSTWAAEQVNARLFDLLQQAEAGESPPHTQAEAKSLDRQLNEVYAKLKASPDPEPGPGAATVTMDNIRRTQRAWLALRDAWVRFAALRYPSVPAHAWVGHFTEQRLKELRDLLAERVH